MLEIKKKVESLIIEFLPSIVPIQSNLSCQLSTHEYGHALEGMVNTSPDCRLDTIHSLGCVDKRMIASTLFVDQTFEATESQEVRKAVT